jgi:hypothetical protein
LRKKAKRSAQGVLEWGKLRDRDVNRLENLKIPTLAMLGET